MENHILWPPERAKKTAASCYMKAWIIFRTIREARATPPKYFMFFEWKIENTSWKVLAYGIYARVVDVSEIEFNKIDWDPVELSGKTAMISTKPRPVFWIDNLVGKSSIKRRTQVFSSYIIGEMFKTNELFVDSCTLTAKFSFCVFIFAVAIWPVTGEGFQNTKWPAVRYFQ